MIGSILTGKKPLVSVERAAPITAVLALMHEKHIGAVLVVESGVIHGMVSERDICARLHTQGAVVLGATAGDIMTAPVITAAPSTTVAEAMETMTARRFRHLPVVDGDSILGVVSIGDLVKRRLEDAEAEAAAMKDYIAS